LIKFFILNLKKFKCIEVLPTSFSIFALFEKQFLLTTVEKQSVVSYKQWVVFCSRIKSGAKPMCD